MRKPTSNEPSVPERFELIRCWLFLLLYFCSHLGNFVGGAEEDRTPDLLRARQALSQLSYGPERNVEKSKSRNVNITFDSSTF